MFITPKKKTHKSTVMKITLLLAWIMLTMVIHLRAQCPQFAIELNSQAAVDNFRDNYPGCVNVVRPITIQGSDITSLQELSGISSVNQLDILRTPNLHTLAGLDSLRVAMTLTIELTGLTNLEGLGGLDSVNWFLRISNNLHLQDLTGLDGLQFADALSVYNNAQLTSLHGLNALTNANSLGVDFNPRLMDLTGMPVLTELHTLYVANNDSLQSLAGLETITMIHRDVLLQSNPALVSIDALHNVSSLEDIDITGNTSLVSLSGLGSLAVVTGNFSLSGNDDLVNLEGLDALESIAGKLEIAENVNLESLSGLASLRMIGEQLAIRNNDALVGLEEIAHVISIGDVLITFNDILAMCSVESICEHLSSGGTATIGGNFDGCNSLSQVLSGCSVATDENAWSNISIYPNPTTGAVVFEGPENQTWQIELYTAQGNKCSIAATEKGKTDLSHLPDGLYFLKIQTGSEIDVIRIIKQQL